MCTLFIKLRRAMIVFVLSFMLSGLSPLLIASDADRARSATPASAAESLPELGADATLAYLKQPGLYSSPTGTVRSSRRSAERRPGMSPKRVSFTRSIAKSRNTTAPARVVAHNIGYDSITHG